MHFGTSRITLRDFQEGDRGAFVSYQMDLRYRRLYNLADDPTRPHELFDLFVRWRAEEPRNNIQVGIFDTPTARLCGCAGLRVRPQEPEVAVLGIELAPSDWGRYGVAVAAAVCLVEHGFNALGLRAIVGDTASGNGRVEKLARWFGARVIARREGPEWMRARGWEEVDWALTRGDWLRSEQRKQLCQRLGLGKCAEPANRSSGREGPRSK